MCVYCMMGSPCKRGGTAQVDLGHQAGCSTRGVVCYRRSFLLKGCCKIYIRDDVEKMGKRGKKGKVHVRYQKGRRALLTTICSICNFFGCSDYRNELKTTLLFTSLQPILIRFQLFLTHQIVILILPNTIHSIHI